MPTKSDQPLRVSATDLQRMSGVILKKVGNDGEHVIIERGGYSVAAMIPIGEYHKLIAQAEEKHTANK